MKKTDHTILIHSIPCVLFLLFTVMSHAFEKNSSFPHYSFPALVNGKPVSVHDFYGEKVVFDVFASW